MKIIVIIPAAGLGTRMSAVSAGAKTKQFFELHGTPILFHTIRKFAHNDRVSEIVIALRKNEMAEFSEQVNSQGFKKPVRVVEGGGPRQNPVANALSSLDAEPDDIVLVH